MGHVRAFTSPFFALTTDNEVQGGGCLRARPSAFARLAAPLRPLNRIYVAPGRSRSPGSAARLSCQCPPSLATRRLPGAARSRVSVSHRSSSPSSLSSSPILPRRRRENRVATRRDFRHGGATTRARESASLRAPRTIHCPAVRVRGR